MFRPSPRKGVLKACSFEPVRFHVDKILGKSVRTIKYAPGMRTAIRDEEWTVKRIEIKQVFRRGTEPDDVEISP